MSFASATALGLPGLRRSLSRAANTISTRVAAQARSDVEEMMTESKRQAPIEHGPLRGTAYVKGPSRRGSDWEIEAGYNADYAIYVHEIPPPEEGAPNARQWQPGERTARHDPPTKWKFLEDPANERFGSFERRAPRMAAIRNMLNRIF